MSDELAPIIKKVKKVSGEGHHGGAWKVAYADFVTAMMAFFLLMWLLNATTEVQRKGIADYFNPTIPVNRISGGGDGNFGGDDIFTEETMARNGKGATNRETAEMNRARGDTGVDLSKGEEQGADPGKNDELEEVEEVLLGRAGESMFAEDVARHIITRLTDEGLVVELFDLPGATLFEPGTDRPNQVLIELTRLVSDIFVLVTNDVAVNGFTRSRPLVLADNPVWDLSSSRADRVRQLLELEGFPPQRLQRVTGYADRKPSEENPMSPRNNRIEVILLREKF